MCTESRSSVFKSITSADRGGMPDYAADLPNSDASRSDCAAIGSASPSPIRIPGYLGLSNAVSGINRAMNDMKAEGRNR